MEELQPRQSFAATFLGEVQEVATAIKVVYSQKLDQAIELLFEAWKDGRWVYVMGNGGSAATATHLVADLTKTICAAPQDRGIKAMTLLDNIPLVTALVNDWGWDNIYVHQLSTLYVEGGVGIAVSVHGGSGQDKAGQWSQNLMKGLQFIKDSGGKTIGLSGFDGGPMKDLVDIGIVVPANSTPIVEGMHVVLHHLIIFGLKQKIYDYQQSKNSGYRETSYIS
ncbi:MAG: SIS domain-containing protein [Candidatus Magasanikbacteria bacterium]|nr:SIS domain-containing protein [Candidatus Magasanikbacteria bacterium]